MSLLERLNNDMKQAMKNKEKDKLSCHSDDQSFDSK